MEFLYYALLGAFAGTAAGLLGIGGGLIMVPVLVFLFAQQGIGGEHLVHVAIGTSLAAIVFSSISSVWSHHRHGAVQWPLFLRMTPGVVIGAIAGSMVAHYLPGGALKIVFGIIEILIALQMGFGRNPSPNRTLPGPAGLTAVSGGIGAIASIMGMGGGAMSTPFFIWCNVQAKNAIATSAAIGLPSAIAGSLGYVFTGWAIPDLPSPSLGYVYLPALAGMVVFSMLFAPLGAKLAHRLPTVILKRIFAVFLMALGLKMLLG
ncbi:MAG: sulfite exporter TauE/SafE family protein [Halothiobacillaceae bacterium]|jgi:uncharacterized membrane protein YfcA|nr:sulfite exporter TauE/SafE family protein [Halothiobacillaceae bacterium]